MNLKFLQMNFFLINAEIQKQKYVLSYPKEQSCLTYFSCKDERNIEIFKDEICKVREHKADGLRISQVCKKKKKIW